VQRRDGESPELASGDGAEAGEASGNRRQRPTLADVAARVGVSANTVSRALRAPRTVRPELRRRIERALDELDYVPNRLAGGLAGSTTAVVGVVITSLFYSEFAATIDAMQGDLAESGLSVMLGNSRYDPEEELRLVRAMLSWRPAAMALVGVDHHPRAMALLASAEVPVVELWDVRDDPIDSVVGMDHEAIGRQQAAHLIARGARRLAFIGAIRDHDHRARKRARGYAAHIAETLGAEPVVKAEAVGGHPDLGDRLAGELLAENGEVDGIICNSDVMAMGVLRRLHGAGRRVPEEVRVIAFGDNEAGACLAPTLSTIRPPRADIGRAAAAAVLARIEGGPAVERVFEAELVARESTGSRPVPDRLENPGETP